MKTIAICFVVAATACGGSSTGGTSDEGADGAPSSRSTSPADGGASSTTPGQPEPSSDGDGAASGSTGANDGGPGSSQDSGDAAHVTSPGALLFSPYKDTSINMNWNTNVISTNVSGTATSLAADLVAVGAGTITLAFATGECGSENWAGVQGGTMASSNVSLLTQAGIRYVVSTGGAAGVFSCATDSGFTTFVGRWMSDGLVGIDFDIEAGQSQAQIDDLVKRIQAAHGTYPSLRFSLTLATLANNDGAAAAESLSPSPADSFNTYGDEVMAAVKSQLGFTGTAATWPGYLTVNLMTMDYGSPGDGVCVVSGGACDMGQSAIQAAFNLHGKWAVPYGNIELTPMIGGNDVSTEQFTLADADAIAAFAASQKLAGIHYWSFDRDTDCAKGSASPTCNTMGSGYAGPHGYLKRFLADGLH
jgi:chitinase